MSTAQQLIDDTLIGINVIDAGGSASSSESSHALTALNRLLSSWSAAGVPVHQNSVDTVTMSGAESYTLASRPLKIRAAVVAQTDGSTHPVEMLTAEQWAAVLDKSRTGLFAKYGWCDGGWTSAKVYLCPKPSAGTLELYTVKPLTAIASLATTIDFPPGYEQAIQFALGAALAPGYGKTVSEGFMASAAEAKEAIGKLNIDVLGAAVPAAEPTA